MKNFLNSEKFAAVVLTLAVLANAHHLAVIYMHVSDPPTGVVWLNKIFSYFLVLTLDAAVIYFVAQGKHIAAGVYAGAVFVLSLCYYQGAGIIPLRVVAPLAQFTFSLMLAATVFIFGRTYAEKLKNVEADQLAELRYQHEQERTKLHSHIQSLETKLKAYTDALTCSECGYLAESQMSLLAHKKHCGKTQANGQARKQTIKS
jgi:hypothetical protein